MSEFEEQASKKHRTTDDTQLEQLKRFTVIVADTGEFAAMQQFSPQDATTNPSLILKAAQNPAYSTLIDQAVTYAKENTNKWNLHSNEELVAFILDKVSVNFVGEISKIVPGYISVEVDARLSFNTQATVERARRIIALCHELGIGKERILIKIASTYEGIRAGEILQREGISCNLTLLFSLVQAAACAEAGITLISPFVGRILDWYKAKTGMTYTAETDPGVLSVKKIYQYFKKFDFHTIVMGASFRNVGEIQALAGCDRLTIAPSLLDELKKSHEHLDRQLFPETAAKEYVGDRIPVDESSFRFLLNEDAMATEKLSEGIRAFVADIIKLETIIKNKL